MFEAFVTLCLAAGGPCRDALLPGYGAVTLPDCMAALSERPPAMAEATDGTPRCAPRPVADLAFTEIAPGVFAHRGAVAEPDPENLGDVANIAFVVGTESVAVIDAGGSRAVGEAVYLAIRARTDLPIRALVLTHMHPDHVYGAAPLAEAGAEVVGREGLARALADRAASYAEGFGSRIGAPGFIGTTLPRVDREVVDRAEIALGGRALILEAMPTAHTATDLVATDSATGILLAGDLVFEAHAPALDGSLRGWRAVLDTLAGREAPLVVPGHGDPALPWPAGSAPLARYLDTLAADTRAALAAGVALSEATRSIGSAEAGHWQLFDLYNARNATAAYTELEWE